LGNPRFAKRIVAVIQGSHVLPLPEPPERLVKDDAAEPGRQAGGFAELIDVREGKDVGFLNRILGIGGVAQDASRHPEESLVIPRPLNLDL
jgi:hypothetical protein